MQYVSMRLMLSTLRAICEHDQFLAGTTPSLSSNHDHQYYQARGNFFFTSLSRCNSIPSSSYHQVEAWSERNGELREATSTRTSQHFDSGLLLLLLQSDSPISYKSPSDIFSLESNTQSFVTSDYTLHLFHKVVSYLNKSSPSMSSTTGSSANGLPVVSSSLPTISLRRLEDNNKDERQRLLDACITHGFCYLDLQDSADLLATWRAMIKLMEEYFGKPISEKMQDSRGSDTQGYELIKL